MNIIETTFCDPDKPVIIPSEYDRYNIYKKDSYVGVTDGFFYEDTFCDSEEELLEFLKKAKIEQPLEETSSFVSFIGDIELWVGMLGVSETERTFFKKI